VPILEYKCPRCDERLEVIASIGTVHHCPDCNATMVILVSRPGWFKPGKYGKGGGK
jgi:putative FmdB family regulatory protein